MKTNPTELLPCPKCGNQPKRNGRLVVGGVLCNSHDHRFQVYGVNQAEADAAWNTRSAPAPVASVEVERGDAPVNTVDREWAAWLSEINCDDPRVTARMRSGELDSSLHVQAFARHRRDLATTPARAVSREEVAKVIGPGAYWGDPCTNPEQQDALAKADAIIALIGGGE